MNNPTAKSEFVAPLRQIQLRAIALFVAIASLVISPFAKANFINESISSMAKNSQGTLFALYRGSPDLVILDEQTGGMTWIALLASSDLVGITFGPGDVLYGVKNDGKIATINIASGAVTDTGWATSSGNGHSIEFNPNDGKLYHFYSAATDRLEKINPLNGVVDAFVNLGGDLIGQVNGIVYDGGGGFWGFDESNKQFLEITSGGVVTKRGVHADGFSSYNALEMAADQMGGPNVLLAHDILAGDTHQILGTMNPMTGVAKSSKMRELSQCPNQPEVWSGKKKKKMKSKKSTIKLKGKNSHFFFLVDNKGPGFVDIRYLGTRTFKIRSTKGNSKIKAKYLLLGGGGNVTGKVKTGKLEIELDAGESRYFKVKLQRKTLGVAKRNFKMKAKESSPTWRNQKLSNSSVAKVKFVP